MNTTNLQKSALAFVMLIAVSSLGFTSAYGYGGGSSTGTRVNNVEVCRDGKTIKVPSRFINSYLDRGYTRGECTSEPQILGISDSSSEANNSVLALLVRISTILSSIQSANDSGSISDEDAGNFRGQLGQIIASFMSLFR